MRIALSRPGLRLSVECSEVLVVRLAVGSAIDGRHVPAFAMCVDLILRFASRGPRSGRTDYSLSAPVTANHFASEPDMMKMIGATHCGGMEMTVSMVESPVVVAGKPPVMVLTVPI
jgi:hypothetical protein